MLDRLVLKENDVFAVTDREGNIRALSRDGQGLYCADTRFLSVYEFSIDHVPMQLLSAAGELSFMNNFQFANLPTTMPDDVHVRARALSIRRNRFIDDGLHERFGLQNYSPQKLSLRLRLTFGSDFRDMFDVRGYLQRTERGTFGAPEHSGREIRLRYTGLDGVERTTRIRFDVKPSAVEIREGEDRRPPQRTTPADGEDIDPRVEIDFAAPIAEAAFDVNLEPGQVWSLTVDVVPLIGDGARKSADITSIDASFHRILEEHERWESRSTRIVTDHELLNVLIRRSLHDLRLTINRLPTGLLPVAGIPWFAVPFGRDSCICSLQTLCLNPDIAYGTLRFLASNQGTTLDPWRDEEPGKILHEIRSGEMAALREVPQTPYYGSVDSTPLFICLFAELMKWTDDWSFAQEMRPHLERALEWLRIYGDRDGDGLIEYESHSTRGIHNQGWKDSFDSIAFPDRTLASPPIAVAEVQGYAFGAEVAMAEMYRRWGEPARAARCMASARRTKRAFEDAFWLDEERFYALALDRDKRQVPAIASNPGHCLLTGLVDGERASAVAERLMREDMRCGWGIRTLSSQYPTFNPMSYHNGSIWPHDNSLVAAGLRRAGHAEAAVRVVDEVLNAGFRLPGYRMPELFCGFSRDRRYQSSPAAYPVSCTPQAWAAGAVFLMLQSVIGLEPDLPNRRLTLRPRLLPWLGSIRFENMRLGSRSVSIRVRRDGDAVRCDVTGADDLEVIVQTPEQG
ncbi:MAG TPA: glycogen debranching N-terminal domain-containing protein [Chloroflexota bacterium]|nr:glycogen debranching N-terminal domain-containing protein [Chloroflexota bacterium]